MSSNIAITLVMATLLLSGVGCTSEKSPSKGESSETDGTESESDGTEGDATPSGPKYAVDCEGAVRMLSVSADTSLSAKCLGGDGTTNCGDSDNCAPQRVTFTHVPPAMRCASFVYFWDGEACVAEESSNEDGALQCQGEDCAHLYPEKEGCENAHAGCNGN